MLLPERDGSYVLDPGPNWRGLFGVDDTFKDVSVNGRAGVQLRFGPDISLGAHNQTAISAGKYALEGGVITRVDGYIPFVLDGQPPPALLPVLGSLLDGERDGDGS